MRPGISRVIRWVVGLLIAAILLGICGLYVAGKLGAFDDFCMIVDRAEVVDELREGDQTLYLVYRVTGFHDKVAFYELYAVTPSFDACGYPKDLPLDGYYAIEDDRDRMVKDVLVRNTKQGQKLEIRYTRQADEGVLPSKAKLIRGDTVKPNPEDNPREWDTKDTMGTTGTDGG